MTITSIARPATKVGDIWMILKDPKKLAKLMVIQEVGQRELARAAGWKAHSYLGRLLAGTATNVEPEPAARIASYLGVGVDDLFLVKVDSSSVQSGQTEKIHSRSHSGRNPRRMHA
ncbi:helix-turn-helix transcriptional regulator [Paenarthrobacter sp. PAE-2]|uniref:helix-turn-helix domain-containing protein n=1 Tax=Paenarthrobacter sp. PAE-2 TaxID=2982532 RepID=UPI00223240D2|nr:helix-turn-helix transcriptional regulator [Paenarthrobacter sp. PAE-2]MCW3766437.1 helix-turn-helix transcriptional regulator [Paenarthrobacter sp. PAE-2]